MATSEKWVSLAEICEYLSLSKDTVKKMVKLQNMPGYKIDRQWRFKISEVDAWIHSNGTQKNAIAGGENHAENN